MWRYIKSKEFWLTLVGIVVFGVAAFFFVFLVLLPAYTRHGDSQIVPEVTKLHLDDAAGVLDDEGLEYEISDSVFMPGMSPLMVVSQDPGGLSKVKPGRKIYLTVNKKVPPKVKFPDVLFVSNYQAKLRLDSWGLGIKNIIYKPHELRNVVLGVEINGKEVKKGEEIAKGTLVDLIVGKGLGSQKMALPDLVGMTYQMAISTLHEYGFNIGSLRFKEDSPEEHGLIIQQNPKYFPGDSVKMGTSIDLFISGPEPDEAIEGLEQKDFSE
ncbi:MAG: PASTA domain-containing protein [Bacteroidia bacterium]|nr:PASTA domain-containing protein [Bacteroidia bacterium]